MNKYSKLFLLSLVAAQLSSEQILIKGGTIFDGKNEAFIADILIEDGKVAKISSNISARANKIIDASDRIITPGIMAPQTQIGIIEIGAISATKDTSSDIYTIGFSIYDAFNPNSTLVPWNRSNGVTSAISLPDLDYDPLSGLASFFLLDSKLQVNGIKDLAIIGEIGGSTGGSRAESLALLEDLLNFGISISDEDALSDEELGDLAEDNKIASELDLTPRDTRALYRVFRENLPLLMRVNRASDILKLIEIKKKFNINLIIMDAQEANLVATDLAENNIAVIINPVDNIPDSFDELASNINLAATLESAGVTIMFSESRSHNYHLIRQNAGNAVANGMSYLGAIKGLTSNVASSFGISGRGTIQEGNNADIVIWEGDPLEPSIMPLNVFINGENMDLSSRATSLTKRYTNPSDKPNTYKK